AVWAVATKREQWPFVAVYANRRVEGHGGLWFEEDYWVSCYEPPAGPPLTVTPLPDHPEYTVEHGRYQPEYEEQFLKMCQSARELTLAVPSAWANEHAMSFLRSVDSLQGDLQERFFNRRGGERERRFRDVLRPISPKTGWT